MVASMDGYALVTGAGSGIGRACALEFARQGAAGVLFADLDSAAAQAAADESRKVASNPTYRTLARAVDVTDEAQVESTVAGMVAEFGRISCVVNSAGIGAQSMAEIADASVAELGRFLNINVMGSFLVTKLASSRMKAQKPLPVSARNSARGSSRGVIVNMASCSSFMATPGLTQYTTSKHAVLGLTRNAALDNAKYGIRVNCICPSWVDTPMIDRATQGSPELKTLMAGAVPIGRIAQVDEIADVILFLCSPQASYVTGSGWIVDGGTSLTSHVG